MLPIVAKAVPCVAPFTQKIRAPMHEYIRHLLLDRLNSETIEDVLKLIRKLPWSSDSLVEGTQLVFRAVASPRVVVVRNSIAWSLMF